MKAPLRPPTIDDVFNKAAVFQRKQIEVNPAGGFFDARTLSTALRRASAGDVIFLPTGEYTAFELRKNIEIRGISGASVIIKGPIKVQAESAFLTGLEIRAEGDEPALIVEKGSLALSDCAVRGTIRAETGARLYLRESLLGQARQGLVLSGGASAEMAASRISGCRVGLALKAGASCALYHSRIDSCASAEEADPGAAIFAEKASVYAEGVTFSGNGVGAYLTDCEDARLLACDFERSETASIIAKSSSGARALHVRGCGFEEQTSARCAQLSLSGGAAQLLYLVARPTAAPALSADQCRLEIQNSAFESSSAAALDLQACHLTATQIKGVSSAAPGLSSAGCQGLVQESTLIGIPPVESEASPHLLLEGCKLLDPAAERAGGPEEAAAGSRTIASILEHLRGSVSQESVRNELEHILRLAHAAQQRKLEGLPGAHRGFHSIFSGAPGTGKLAAARVLAAGLHAFGIVPSADVEELFLDSGAGANGHSRAGGLVFVRAPQATSSIELEAAQRLLERLAASENDVVVLAGERDEVRRLLRTSPLLSRAFQNTLHFASYGPIELATLFAQMLARDRITLSRDARRQLLLAFHLYCDRKDKRFSNTQGVEVLYDATRRRYLERCSHANRFDLELEPRDLDLPQDKALRSAVERSPAFVSFCPSCARENPWLPSLGSQYVCLHCGTPYVATWGLWKDSATYRRARESLTKREDTTGAVARRANLPSR